MSTLQVPGTLQQHSPLWLLTDVLLQVRNEYISSGRIYYSLDGQWLSLRTTYRLNPENNVTAGVSICNGDISLRRPRFRDLVVGDVIIRPNEIE